MYVCKTSVFGVVGLNPSYEEACRVARKFSAENRCVVAVYDGKAKGNDYKNIYSRGMSLFELVGKTMEINERLVELSR